MTAATYTEHVCDRCGKRSRNERIPDLPAYWSTHTTSGMHQSARTRHFCDPCTAVIEAACHLPEETQP